MPRHRRSSDGGGVQVVQRTVAILRVLAEHPDGLSLSQIAGRLGLARSTVHRLVAALHEERFAMAVSPNGKVLLSTLSDHELVQLLPPTLERLTPNTITSRDELLQACEEINRVLGCR